jgi:hypothetical protein
LWSGRRVFRCVGKCGSTAETGGQQKDVRFEAIRALEEVGQVDAALVVTRATETNYGHWD